MVNYLIIHIYVDKNRNMIMVPFKQTKIGYALATEPYKVFDKDEWNNASVHVLDLLIEAIKKPIAEDINQDVFKKICGNRGFKQFSKKHICISVRYNIAEKAFEVSNQPRLSDGSYGTEKNSISEEYCIKYACTKESDLLQENFLKAYEDAEQYLKRIGLEL